MVVPLTSVGPYQLLEPLGGNGLFLGLAPSGERVAVRVIEADVAADPRFRTEVAAARRVNEAFTTPVVAADLDADVPWLATVYVAGPTLADAVRDRGPVPAASLLLLATGLASGLRAIHDAGLVHRDLNPSNVLLDEDGPRVTGFGLSGVAGVTGADLGSPGFLAPEQALGQDAGPPSDIFSLGAVLVYAAGGQGPFGAGSSALLMYRLVNSAPDLGGLPGELRSLVDRCLAKQPDSRPTASELVAELRGASVSSVPSVALPSSVASVASVASVVGVAAGESWRGGRHSRRGWSRSRGSRSRGPAWIAAGVVAACAAAVFVLTGAVHLPPAGHVQPQAGAVVAEPDSTSQAPLISSSSASAPGAFGAGAALAFGARGSDHSVYAAGPAGVLVPEPVGSGVGAAVRAVGFCFGVVVRFALRFGVGVAFRVTVGFAVGVLFAVGFHVAVVFTVTVVFTVVFTVAVAVCVLLAVGFLLAVIFGFVVTVVVGFLVHVGVRARLAVRVREFGLIARVTGLAAASLG